MIQGLSNRKETKAWTNNSQNLPCSTLETEQAGDNWPWSLAGRSGTDLRAKLMVVFSSLSKNTRVCLKIGHVQFTDFLHIFILRFISRYNKTRMESRRMRWAGHVVRIGDMRIACKHLVGNLKGRDHLWDPGLHGRINGSQSNMVWGVDWIHLSSDGIQ
jgi:hypothetical protein